MSRFLRTALILAALPTIVAAASYPYANARFNFTISIPIAFRLVSEADNGDGRTYETGDTTLRVWAHYLETPDLKYEVRFRRDAYLKDGFDISYDRETAGWASLSGTRNDRIFYHRVIRLCQGAVASFSLDFPKARKPFYGPMVTQLVKTLRPNEGCTNAQGAAPQAN